VGRVLFIYLTSAVGRLKMTVDVRAGDAVHEHIPGTPLVQLPYFTHPCQLSERLKLSELSLSCLTVLLKREDSTEKSESRQAPETPESRLVRL
jgi:hypothetical protein